MLYLDTSILTAYYCPEAFSKKAQALVMKEVPVISNLTEVELSSAVARKVRFKEIEAADAVRILTLFKSHIDSHVFKQTLLEPRHYQLARDWISSFKTSLRTLDALHLAVCSRDELDLATSDKRLASAARELGQKVHYIS